MMKHILLTGAAGFIASNVADILLSKGIEVTGIDNLNDYYSPKLKQKRLDFLKSKHGFNFIDGDIENIDTLESLFKSSKFDGVVNLAARAGIRYSIVNPHVYVTTNIVGTVNLLELMRKYDVNKFVLASSSSVYANEETPFKETLEVNTPISPYAATKKAAEMLAYSHHHLYNFDVSVLRYFTVYGPAGRPDMSYFKFIQSIQDGKPIELYGDGTQSRDFTFVSDIARGTVLSLEKANSYQIYNLGGGKQPVSINYMLAKLEEFLGKKALIEYKPFHNADMKETGADISKAESLLGWHPEIGIDQGLEITAQWHLENADFLKTIPLVK